MGGAVSSGRDNDELIDNLMGSNYIRTRAVEQVFRALDRADYMTRDAKDQAYKDLAWRNGLLHMSAPCIYSEVMENLELKPGLSFLNVGSGTGYLSTLVGLVLGSQGISHGVELRPSVIEYANKRLAQFLENSPSLDEFDFCEPKFYVGNALCLAPLVAPYDRVYCGAGCPIEYENYFKQLIKVGGVLVMPLEDNLVQVKRVSEQEWVSRTVLNVSFATLTVPSKQEAANLVKLEEQTPVRLQAMARAAIRAAMRAGLRRRHPELRRAPARAPPAKKACPRRICIPIDDESDVEGLGVLHDLYRDTGASEMNALLSFMLSMGHNRVAGALRFDTHDSSDSDEDSYAGDHGDSDNDDGDDDGGGSPGVGMDGFPRPDDPSDQDPTEDSDDRPRRCGLITLDFRDILGDSESARPEDESSQPEDESARPEDESARPEDESSQPEDESARPEDERARSEGETARLEGDSARPQGECARPEDETFGPEGESARLEGESARTEGESARLDGENGRSEDEKAENDCNAQLEAGDAQNPTSSDSRKSDQTRKARRGSGDSRVEDRRRRGSDEKSWDSGASDDPGQHVPAEVEIYLGKTNTTEAGPSKWSMEWEDGAALEGSSDDEPRQKDSGLGEETSPDSASSHTASPHDASPHDARDSLSDDVDDRVAGRRRLVRRASAGRQSPQPPQRRAKRRAAEGGDLRRVRLALLMKQGVRELPLPAALKMFVNLQRCYTF